MRRKSLGAVAAAGAVAVTVWMVSAEGEAADAGLFPYRDAKAVARGKEIYGDFCASCHGVNLEGQENWRGGRDEDGLALAPPHDASGHTWHHPDQQLFLIVKHGTEALVGGDYKSAMIGFQDSLSDAEIREVMAFIKSTWPEEVIETHNGINQQAASQ